MKLTTFGNALDALKQGKEVYRQLWEGTKLRLIPGSGLSEPYIMAKLWNGHIVVWVPTHDDILSEDWIIND